MPSSWRLPAPSFRRPDRRAMPARRLLSRLLGLAVLAACAAAPTTEAQTSSVRGFVRDAATGQPLLGVNVALWAPATPDRLRGSATDTDGFYAVAGLEPGRYVIRASAVGYTTRLDTLVLDAGGNAWDAELAPDARDLGVATVESERTAGSANVEAGFQRIRAEDIRAVPAPDVSGDLVNYLVSLPGIVTSGDRGGQLFVRGGEPSQNGVFLDGIPVFQPFHVLGFYSAFPADLLQSADVYAGGFDSRFGGLLSSVLDVSARPGDLRRLSASASVAPFVASAAAEGPLVRDQVSLLASARVSTVDQIAARYIDDPLPFTFGDLFGKVYYTPTATSRFSLTGLHTYDRGGIGDPTGPRADEVRYTNSAGGFRYLLLPSSAPFLAEVKVSYSDYDAELGPSSVRRDTAGIGDLRTASLSRFTTDIDLTNLLPNVDFRYGLFLRRTFVSSVLGGLFQNVALDRRESLDAGIYAQPEFRLGPLKVSPGLRYSISQGLLEPRLRAGLEAGPHRLSFAAGRYYQTIVGVSDRRDATSVFTAWAVAPDNAVPVADHVIGGYRLRPVSWADVSVEGFYKQIRNLSVAEWTAVPRLTTRLQPADGEAYGMDLRAEVRPGRALFLVNYGLSFVEYTSTSALNEIRFGDETLRYRPAHDRRHQATVVASVPVAGFTASLRWQYGSGLPFSQALGFDVFILPSGSLDPTQTPGTARVIYERPFNALLPDYHRLDLSVDREFRLRAGLLTLQAGVLNTYDRRNLFAFDIFTLDRVDQLPLIPTFGLRFQTR